jgi:flagellar hook-associated protein 1 FlgK
MADLLSIGASGIKAYSRALATVSDNIANAQTVGYARRSTRMEDRSTLGDRILYRDQIRPDGVAAVAVDRAVDEWLINDSRTAGGEAGRTGVRLSWAEAVERAVGDGPGGVGQSMTRVFNAADTLASDPANATLRANFLQSVSDTAAAFRATANDLQSVANGIVTDAQQSTDQLNTNLTALRRVNDGLAIARDGSTNKASLLDERDRLVDSISATIGVSASFDGRGVTTLRAALPSGEILVSATITAQVSATASANGTLGFSVNNGTISSLTPTTGRLAGLAEGAVQLSSRRTQLDALSSQFATSINAAHQAGTDANGNPGVALLNLGSGAASIVAATLDPSDVAAADSASANGNMLSFSSLRGANGSEAGWNALVAQQSMATASARAQDAAATGRQQGADEARNAMSGVDLDHEAAELLRFQQAYDGAAKTIQVARETLQTILNIF